MNAATYADIVHWNDDTLLRWRRETSAELERDPANQPLRRLYDASTTEVANRAAASHAARRSAP